ncbi:excinuclease ABC subunit UvrA [Dialister sp.]|uniref:excinuclease ABC subunit UvrA n=1 Tax=Dialister sp. TaxID=1955814 RepID=UPI002E80CA87|nr:excinuclease ABC subunit UvrA [Dialister sp.]MEE3452816.1 excinuclease ABC subunit UvrA [Dialister sp.]
MEKGIVIQGARQNNLKNINLSLPRNKLIVFTGLSGSGKSSLAFDTIYAEGQRKYVESLSAYARQFLGQMNKPDIDKISGLSPAISIDQKSTSHNPRSTVGTVTEIHDYLRMLYAHASRAFCPNCGKPIERQTVDQIVDSLISLGNRTKLMILGPVAVQKKGTHKKLLEELRKEGYVRVRVDSHVYPLAEDIELEKNKKHTVEVVVDRVIIKEGIVRRLTDSVEAALKLGDGLMVAAMIDGPDHLFSTHFACPDCGISLPKPEPRIFSFNNPFGACPACMGLGSSLEADFHRILPDHHISFRLGAIKPFPYNKESWLYKQLDAFLKSYDLTMDACYDDLPDAAREEFEHGGHELLSFRYTNQDGETKTYQRTFEGIVPMTKRRYEEAWTDKMKETLANYLIEKPCPVCHGARLRPESLAFRVGNKNLAELSDMPVSELLPFLDRLNLTEKEKVIADQILREVKNRLTFLSNVGLEYLTLSRGASTLSGGEAQRIRLATQIGSGLVGVLYILDEPSIGLHQRDNDKLLATLKGMRDLGNTLIVVEHDEDTIRTADWVVDIGPGAGEKGGYVVAEGTPEDIKKSENSITGAYLRGDKYIPLPKERRKGNGLSLTIHGASEHNLKHIDVKFPLGAFTVVTGESGSGKSTLVNEILYQGLSNIKNHTSYATGKFDSMEGAEYVDKIIDIDQQPIGRTPRSNPATYTGVFNDIRELFSQTSEAKMRGYKPGRFSFNIKGGRCEACHGDGIIKIEMQFLSDVYVPCEVCHGVRYNRETLEVRYKGKNISDVLNMTVDEAVPFFENHPKILRKLETLEEVGLGYIHLGQPATTMSGGEAQRVKLATELMRRGTGDTLYILDEPTTGLHSEDIRKLLIVLQKLVDQGNTVVVIEHNLDVVKVADYIIDLGPEGGDKGGEIVAVGTPEEICKVKRSYTGQYLLPVIERTKEIMRNHNDD